MSEENVERYGQGIDAFNRRELEAFLALADPDVVGNSRITALEGDLFHGHNGARDWWKTLLDVFPDFTIEVLSVRDVGQLTVAGLCNRAHGEVSAAPFEQFTWQVCEWHDGLVVRWQIYTSEQDALEAAGLSE